MRECIIKKSIASPEDIEKISTYARREMSEDELYIFNVALCNNDIDRDGEKFSIKALEDLAELFVGKTGISDHSMRSADQKARIFDTWVERHDGEMTADGEVLHCLMARAYMLNNEDNRALIEEIDAGIKKEVSVSCSMESGICSVCGKDRRKERCEHTVGKSYNGKLCYTILDNASDAYEFSFVAVPAQRGAGVTKSYTREDNMDNVIKSICDCNEDITLTKSQARELTSYIDELKEEALLAEDYKKQLSKEVINLFAKSFPNMDKSLFASITSVMTTKELIGFRDGMKKTDKSKSPAPQLSQRDDKQSRDYSQFRI